MLACLHTQGGVILLGLKKADIEKGLFDVKSIAQEATSFVPDAVLFDKAPSTIVTPPLTVPSFLVYQTIAKLFNPYPKFVIVLFAKFIDVPKSFK
jgi:hypothetical protein